MLFLWYNMNKYYLCGGGFMKKLEGNEAKLFKEIIQEDEMIVEVDGKNYYLSVIETSETTVKEDVEIDPHLKQKLLQAKKDIMDENIYSTEEVLELIDQGKV